MLQIRKISNKVWKHVDSNDGAFILTKFTFKNEFNKGFIVEVYGAKRREYTIDQIEVYNIGGSAETFLNFEDLLLRLEVLKYPAFYRDGEFEFNPSAYDLSEFQNNETDRFAKLSDIIGGDGVQSVSGSMVDNTDPLNPVINSDSTKLDKVSTVDVDKAYIKLADGTQAMKPLSEIGGSSTKEIQCFWNSFAFSALDTWRSFTRNTSNIYFGTPNQSLGTGAEPSKVGTWFGDSNIIKLNGAKQIKKFILSVRQEGANRDFETFFVVADYTDNRGSETNGQILSNEVFNLPSAGSEYIELTPNTHSDLNDNSVLYVIIRQIAGSVANWQGVDFKIIYE